MNDFFKRLGWRLTGGIVTIALGAFAAAQAQRQGIVDEQPLPTLESPAWASALPIPIQAGPEQSSRRSVEPGFSGTNVMPAAFAGDLSADGPSNSWVSPPEQASGYDPSQGYGDDNALVARVNHEEPGMSDAMPAMAIPQVGADPAMGSAPSMSMPMMGLPEAAEVAAGQNAGPAMASMSMPQEASPQANPDPPSMAMPVMNEIQFDQGPFDQEANAGMSPQPTEQPTIEPAVAQPEMAMPQSFVGDYEGEPGFNNSLRSDAPQTRSEAQPAYDPGQDYNNDPQGYPEPQGYDGSQPGYDVAAQRQMPLPSLPQPQASPYASQPEQDLRYADEPNYANETNYPRNTNPPARLAGHQSMGLPPAVAGAAVGAVGGNNRGRQNNYMQDPGYSNHGRDEIAISMPGDRRLEGVQSPSVVIHKRAPAEVKVGRAATFVIQVRNVGSAEALGVQVHDRIPAGMELVEATPAPVVQGDSLIWDLGSMPIGDERAITMQLIPREEGELGSVARVTFEAAASVRTRSTRPELRIVQRAPQKVLIGQQLEIELEISNIGTGEATGVILQEDVPQGLDHPRGRQLDNALGSLRPGESRREILRLRAVEPGMIRNVVHLIAEDAAEATHSVDVEVVSPALSVQLAGPGRRYLERQATYMVNIENNGTAPASNVEVIAYLDRGFTFVSTENNGHYDSNRHAVLWSIVNLPPGDAGSVPLTLLPVEEGEQAIRLEAVADLDTRAQSESTVSVQSQAELTFSIADTADPIELGSETTYEIRVKNSGSRNDTNVQVRMIVPPGIELLESDTAGENDGRGSFFFAPHKNLAAGGDLVYRIRVRGIQPDTHLVKAIVTSDQARVPVTKEESTMVYQDR